LGQLQLLGNLGQRGLLDQVGAQPGQVAFVDLGEALEQQRRHDEVQHRVTQKLQPLVVAGAMAAVRERLLEQRGIAEMMAETGFQAG